MNPDHQEQLNRLNKIEGQIKGIKKMIENRRYCVDILTQTKAVTAALQKVEQSIMKNHVQHCLRHAVESKNELEIEEKINEIMGLLAKRM